MAAGDRTLDCSTPTGTATAILDLERGAAIWSVKNPKTGTEVQSTLRLSTDNGQYVLDTGHSIGRYNAATGELVWSYGGRIVASDACREVRPAPDILPAPAGNPN